MAEAEAAAAAASEHLAVVEENVAEQELAADRLRATYNKIQKFRSVTEEKEAYIRRLVAANSVALEELTALKDKVWRRLR